MRARIVDAAFALLRQDGPQAVSIRKIADRIGVSHMTLYGYFENRAAIIQALRQRGFEQMDAFCAQAVRRAETGDALAEVRALLERFIQLSHAYPYLFQLVWRRDPSWQTHPQRVARMLDYLSQLIRLGTERGQCTARDPALAAAVVFSAVNGSLVLYHSVTALGETGQAQLETEVIQAAMTYLTK
jgi:AcrR family transcriptional regulator